MTMNVCTYCPWDGRCDQYPDCPHFTEHNLIEEEECTLQEYRDDLNLRIAVAMQNYDE